MKKFLFKISIFVLIYFCLLSIFETFLPFYWGDNLLTAKMDYLHKHADDYNTVFLGSSRTNWQVIPKEFDKKTAGKTQSFNLGMDGALFDETMYVLENLLEDKALTNSIEYIFFEINDVSNMKETSLFTSRQAYYFNWDIYQFMNKYFSLFDNELNEEKATRVQLSFIQNLLKTNMLKNGIDYLGKKSTGYEKYISEWEDGAHPKYIGINEPEWETRKQFLKDSTYLPNYVPKLKIIFDKTSGKKASKQVQFLIDTANKLIEKADSKGVKLIFVNFLPNIKTSHRRKIIFDGILATNKINMEEPYRHPEFYKDQYFYDRYHLNGTGSKLFSRKLAEMFVELTTRTF